MATARWERLLKKAGAALEDGRDPFSTDWLVENNVTADECMALSRNIAHAIEAYLANRSVVAALMGRQERGEQ